MEIVTLVCELPSNQAYALAELCKRIGYNECRNNAVSGDEARDMIDALERVRESLKQEGVSVR